MWNTFKCRNGTGESGYMGFADIYDNTISFLLEEPEREKRDYFQLVESNRKIFERLYVTIREEVRYQMAKPSSTARRAEMPAIRLVEPRELLHLLNYIETHDTRLLYAPRPFYRSNVFCLASLLQMRNDRQMACLFCAEPFTFSLIDGWAYFMRIRETDHGRTIETCNMEADEIGGRLFANDVSPHLQTVCGTPPSEECEKPHHPCCPIPWLHRNENAVWNYKEAVFVIRGVSKFHHMMQFLTQYPRPRENASWLCLVNRMSGCPVPGASLATLENLFRIIAYECLRIAVERLKMTDRKRWTVHYSVLSDFAAPTGPPLQQYHEPMHVNQYISEVVNLADNADGFENHGAFQVGEMMQNRCLPLGGSRAVLTPERELRVIARANRMKPYTTAHRPFDQTLGMSGTLNAVEVVRSFADNTVTDLQYYRLLYVHGYLIQSLELQIRPGVVPNNKTEPHICLYCGAVFRNILLNFENAMRYYLPAHVDRLIKYAVSGASMKHMHRYVYGRHLPPVSQFQATFPRDLTSTVLPRKVKANERLQKALVWLSASMDALHSDECPYRLKRRSFVTDRCCVCLGERNEEEHSAMSCGHELCTSCYNEISITDCCMCKRGYRKRHMTVSKSVILGYVSRYMRGNL